MRRVPTQAVLPFTRSDRVVNRQISERAAGVKVRAGLGRPKKKRVEGQLARMPHGVRVGFRRRTAVHLTLRCSARAPSLRSRRRYACIKQAIARLHSDGVGFKVIHYAVLGNHLHLVVEADSQFALSKGMQRLTLSISRFLNAENVRRHGGCLDPRAGKWSARRGWIGRIFADRYHAHLLNTLSEMTRALRYVRQNAEHHFGTTVTVSAGGHSSKESAHDDPFCSFALPSLEVDSIVRPPAHGTLRYALALAWR